MAGRIGRPHGLDGSFHVADAAAELLPVGAEVFVGERVAVIAGRKGTDAAPILRLSVADSREAAQALRGQTLEVAKAAAPPLAPDEFWADELVGCAVVAADGREIGAVVRMVGYPSCDVLELDQDGLLVPMVRDAIRSVDVAGRRIEVDAVFLGL